MNNKGQVLVMFVLLLPVLFLVIYFFVSEVYLNNEKKELNRIANRLCKYYKKNYDIDKVLDYGNKMDKDLVISISKKEDTITIKLEKDKELFNKKSKIKKELLCE